MNNIIVWDAGEDKGDERYTVLAGNRAFIVGISPETPDYVDVKNIEVLSASEIVIKDMDHYPRIKHTDLPTVVKTALIEKQKQLKE